MNNKSPAIIILSQNSLSVARQILKALPEAKIYGLKNRTQNVDIFFQNFSDTLKELFSEGTPIIGICASGILIRTLAPLLSNKWQEPPLLAIAEDGSAVVPLLGGINGVNHLARCISSVLNVSPAITTTGDIRFQTTLLSPPTGYHLANPENAKTFISDLLAGNTLNLQGNAPWLTQSKLPISSNGNLTILITEKLITPPKNCLIYHPTTIAIGFIPDSQTTPESKINQLQEILTTNQLSPKSLSAIFTLDSDVNHPAVVEIAQKLNLPIRFFTPAEIQEKTTLSLALKAAGDNSSLIATTEDFALAIAEFPIDINNTGHQPGHLAIIGTGPGSEKWMSPEVKDILKTSTDWIGYKTYLNLAEPFRTNQTRHESDNREELERAKHALNLAATGKKVAVISSGDPGIFAMASAVFEVLEREKNPQWDTLKIQVCPGISAMQAAAALAGAPLGHDFCAISLSDILKPWSIIEQRIKAAASADFVIAFYNPISKERRWQLAKAKEILLQYRDPETPLVVAKNCGRVGQTVEIFTLQNFTPETADMRTIILIGSSQTRILPRPHEGVWVYTPRRYDK
ncbi:MAG TPA: precorrin-3B C(17)-methyltransferase [Halomicronema sp.]